MDTQKTVGDYDLLGILGSGNFGTVYKAEKDKFPGIFYAIKQVKKETLMSNKKLEQLFRTEVKIMKFIKHPNILHCYEF